MKAVPSLCESLSNFDKSTMDTPVSTAIYKADTEDLYCNSRPPRNSFIAYMKR